MSQRDDQTPVAASVHRLEIVSKFFADGYTAECSCGWRSEEMSTHDGALAKGRAHEDERLSLYREGFADGLRWVLGNCELDDADRERIEEAIDGD